MNAAGFFEGLSRIDGHHISIKQQSHPSFLDPGWCSLSESGHISLFELLLAEILLIQAFHHCRRYFVAKCSRRSVLKMCSNWMMVMVRFYSLVSLSHKQEYAIVSETGTNGDRRIVRNLGRVGNEGVLFTPSSCLIINISVSANFSMLNCPIFVQWNKTCRSNIFRSTLYNSRNAYSVSLHETGRIPLLGLRSKIMHRHAHFCHSSVSRITFLFRKSLE